MNTKPLKEEKMRLKDKICAITGAGKGIGRKGAELFAKEGAFVYILELDEKGGQKAEEAIRRAGGKAKFLKTDVSSYESVGESFRIIGEENDGKMDVLYNNASVYLNGRDGILTEIAPEVWQKVLGINLNSIFNCCHHAIPMMQKNRRGAIINTASSAGVIGIPKCDAYTATKGATVSLTRSLAVEYGKYGIRTNCIAPAAIATDMVKQSNPDGPDFDSFTFLHLRTPVRRWGTPEEVARLALFLASEDSSYVNGAVITADGGITICGDLARAVEEKL